MGGFIIPIIEGLAAAGVTSSLFGGNPTGQPIQPQTPPSWLQLINAPPSPGQNQVQLPQELANAVASSAIQWQNGQPVFAGVPGYTGPLSPDLGSTMLPNVWGGWQSQAPGTGATQTGINFGQTGALSSFNAQNPYGGAFANPYASLLSTGGVSNNQPLWGMQNLINTGAAGGGGIPLANLAQGSSSLTNPLSQTFAGSAPTEAGLQGVVAGGGNPINQLPAWQAMVAAQQRNIQEGAASLSEAFGTSDNRFSSSYGTAMSDYLKQTQLGQNALLGQMTATAGENAQNRLLSAAGTLGGLGAGAGGMLTSTGAGAASQLGGFSAGATTGLFNNQNALLPSFMNYSLGQGGLAQGFNQQGLAGAGQLGSLYGMNLGLGNQLGMSQYGIGQSQINNAYSEFLRTQPQANPFISNLQQLATYYPSQYTASYSPGSLGPTLGGLGGLLGALPGLQALSDERLKENVKKVGKAGGVNLYTFNFKGDPTPRFGPMAQEVERKYPEAVIRGDETNPWMIKTDALAAMLAKAA